MSKLSKVLGCMGIWLLYCLINSDFFECSARTSGKSYLLHNQNWAYCNGNASVTFSFLNIEKIHLDYAKGNKHDYLQTSRGNWSLSSSLILLLTSLGPRLQPDSSFVKNVLKNNQTNKTTTARTLVESKRESTSKSVVIGSYPELSINITFHLKLTPEPVFEEQKWMCCRKISTSTHLTL